MSTAITTRSSSVPARSVPAPYNTLAPIALALTFVTIVGGIVCGHVALAQIHRTGERGAWMAVVALLIGYAVVGFFALLFAVLVGGAGLAVLHR